MEVRAGGVIRIWRETAAWRLWVWEMRGAVGRTFLTAGRARNGALALLGPNTAMIAVAD